MFPPLQLYHLIILSPFTTCHLTSPTHLSHLVTSLKSYTFPAFPTTLLLSHLSQLTSLAQRQIDTSKITTFFHYPRTLGFNWGNQYRRGFTISKIEKSSLPGNDHKLLKLEPALLPSKPLKHVRCDSIKTSYTQHKIPVMVPYSQYPSLQPFNTILPLNFIPIP